jgi:hypothetical protein
VTAEVVATVGASLGVGLAAVSVMVGWLDARRRRRQDALDLIRYRREGELAQVLFTMVTAAAPALFERCSWYRSHMVGVAGVALLVMVPDRFAPVIGDLTVWGWPVVPGPVDFPVVVWVGELS